MGGPPTCRCGNESQMTGFTHCDKQSHSRNPSCRQFSRVMSRNQSPPCDYPERRPSDPLVACIFRMMVLRHVLQWRKLIIFV